jgi:hypothetical protein
MQLGLLAWQLQDVSLARRVIDALTPYRACWVHYILFVMGPVSWPLGLAHAVIGSYDAAAELLEESLDRVRDAGARAHLPLVSLDLAAVLKRRAADGDVARVAVVLAEARAAAVEVGADEVIVRIDAAGLPGGAGPAA